MKTVFQHSAFSQSNFKTNSIMLFLVSLLISSCNSGIPSEEKTSEKQSLIAMAEMPSQQPQTEKAPYELSLKMNQLETDVFELEVQMNLYQGAHYISPYAKREFKGKFFIEIDDTNDLLPISTLKEIPPSKEEYDAHPFVGGMVNWVRVDTKYLQQFQLNSKEDFELMGLIQFTIEPRCTLEKIPIIIKHKDGKLVAEIFGC